jgi:excisionase family DNA binding protein
MRSTAPAYLQDQPVAADEKETAEVVVLEQYLAQKQGVPALVGPNGESLPLPKSVYRVLTAVLREMAQGNAVAVVPVHHELTTQEAADLLNVSRPFLISLLERGELPFSKVGTHRRIRFSDLTEYRKRRDEIRSRALDGLAVESAKLGL